MAENRIYFGSLDHQARQDYSSAEVDSGDEEAVQLLPLTDNPTSSDLLHQRMIEELELTKRMREIAVPTSDELVKARLMELDEPIILFGETKPERRNRLRTILAQRGITQGMPSIATAADTTTTGLEEAGDQPRPFQTEGPPALKTMRLWILHDSLQRAQKRLALARQKAALHIDDNAEEARLATLSAALKKYVIVASEPCDERTASNIAFSPTGEYFATSGWTGVCKLWNTQQRSLVRTLKSHTERASCVRFHPACGLGQSPSVINFATCAADRTVKLWSLESDKELHTLEGHEDRVNRLVFHPSGKYLASTSFDRKYNIYDLEVGKCLISQDGHSRAVYGISWHPDGALIATAGLDAFGRIWDVRIGKAIQLLRGHVKQILAVDFAPNGYHIITGSDDHTVRVWDLRSNRTLYILPAHTSLISEAKFQRIHGNFIITSGYDGTVKIWSSYDWSLIKTLVGNESRITGVDVFPTDNPNEVPRYIATTSFDKTWKFWGPEEEL